MYIYQTKGSKTSPIPTQIEFLRVANRRGLLRTTKEQILYRNLEMGFQGEQYVIDALQKYGREHWVALRNLWLDHYGIYESDILLLINHTPYVFEVKNYEGLFEYKNNRCFINGRKSKENCIQQAEKSLMNLQDICGGINRSITAKGALLMVGEHNDVQIHSEVDGIDVKNRSQLRNYIQEIARLEEMQYQKPMDIRRLLDHFERNERLNPFGPLKSYTPAEVLSGRCGIYCKTCGSYEVESSKLYIKCKNNHEELRREAVLRTIHEYGVLIFEQDFMTRSDLQIFVDERMSFAYLISILNQHFERIHDGRYAKYVNKKALF